MMKKLFNKKAMVAYIIVLALCFTAGCAMIGMTVHYSNEIETLEKGDGTLESAATNVIAGALSALVSGGSDSSNAIADAILNIKAKKVTIKCDSFHFNQLLNVSIVKSNFKPLTGTIVLLQISSLQIPFSTPFQSLTVTTGMPLTTLAWSLAVGTDIGGSATPIGASANVVGTSVAAKAGHPIGWGKYCKICVPATVIVMLISTIFILTFIIPINVHNNKYEIF